MAARKSPLRAVSAGEKPTPAKPKTVTQAAKGGTTRELLEAMRDRTATAVEDPNTAARDLAALTKRLMEIVRDIEAIDAREAEEVADSARRSTDQAFDASAI